MSGSKLVLNANWSLDTTLGKTITIGTSVLRAATSDNVQAFALLACEKYGATLPISHEVCTKMEQLGKRNYTSHTMKHFAALIGYSPGDAADYFATTEAGGEYALYFLERSLIITIDCCSTIPWVSCCYDILRLAV